MNVTLSEGTQVLIEERMRLGHYASPDDVVRVALDALRQVEEGPIEEPEVADIRLSREQVQRGEVVDWRVASNAIFGAAPRVEHGHG